MRVEHAVRGDPEDVVGHHRIEDRQRIRANAACGAGVAVVVVEPVRGLGVAGGHGQRASGAGLVQLVDAAQCGEQRPLILDRAAEQIDILAAAVAHRFDRQRLEEAALNDGREGHQEPTGQRIRLRVGHQRVLGVEHILSGNAA